jgi:Tfp pilus assembly protein PilF
MRLVTTTAAVAVVVALTGCSLIHGKSAASPAAPGKGGDLTASSASANGRVSGAASTVAELLQVGIGQAEQRDWSGADTTFGDVLAVSPDNVYALYNLGLVAQTTGDDSAADSYYDKAIKANGHYTPAMYNLAITLEDSRPAEAISLYKKIVAINPKASTAYLRMAFVYATEGDSAQAKSAQAEAITIDPALGKYSLPAAR